MGPQTMSKLTQCPIIHYLLLDVLSKLHAVCKLLKLA